MEFPDSRQLTPSCGRRVYKPSKSGIFEGRVDVVKGLHYGQRKLILSEIEFLSALLQQSTTSALPLLVVYAGAANGSHLPFLFHLFPEVRFVLIDPAPFCDAVLRISESLHPVVEIIEGYCTDELCMRLKRDYSSSYRLVLVSDIRSGVPCRSTNREHTAMIMRDNAWQRGWYGSLGAECAMLKFHPPYPRVQDPASPKYEADDDTPSSIDYIDGALLWGVWAPKSSSEVRLVVYGELKERTYDTVEFEEQCYHYNTTGRFQRDVEAERLILQRYINLGTGVEGDAVVLSRMLSESLGFPKFLPLEMSEDEARIASLLYLSKVKSDVEELLPMVKSVTTAQICSAVANRCGLISADSFSFPNVPDWFWTRVATSKNLGESYGFPPLPRQQSHHPTHRPGRQLDDRKRLRDESKP